MTLRWITSALILALFCTACVCDGDVTSEEMPRNWLDQLDYTEIYNAPAGFGRHSLEGNVVLVENTIWGEWADRGYYPDVNRYAKDNPDVVVVTLADPAPAHVIEERIAAMGIQHPVLVDRGFRYGYSFLDRTATRLVGSSVTNLWRVGEDVKAERFSSSANSIQGVPLPIEERAMHRHGDGMSSKEVFIADPVEEGGDESSEDDHDEDADSESEHN